MEFRVVGCPNITLWFYFYGIRPFSIHIPTKILTILGSLPTFSTRKYRESEENSVILSDDLHLPRSSVTFTPSVSYGLVSSSIKTKLDWLDFLVERVTPYPSVNINEVVRKGMKEEMEVRIILIWEGRKIRDMINQGNRERWDQ